MSWPSMISQHGQSGKMDYCCVPFSTIRRVCSIWLAQACIYVACSECSVVLEVFNDMVNNLIAANGPLKTIEGSCDSNDM